MVALPRAVERDTRGSLGRRGDIVKLTIMDDGIGFALNTMAVAHG
ncbi:MAG: hypothetical protein Q7S40_21715 [Opitutaceae bacterium]|nr:hypothetical protein [Opitutaceae bacterium]